MPQFNYSTSPSPSESPRRADEEDKKQAMDPQSPTFSCIKSPPSSSMTTSADNKHGEELPRSHPQETTDHCDTPSLRQKVLAEIVATYVMVFAGCGAVMVNKSSGGQVGLVGIATTWGVVVMAMVYATSHISGTHMNPAVTLAFALCHGFPWRQVPWYIASQALGSTGAAFTLKLLFHEASLSQQIVTRPLKDDYLQSFVLEIIITFILLFVVSGVGMDKHAIGSMAGLVIGATVAMNVFIAGPVSGASMNPARSLGPAIVANSYKELYVYLLGPTMGAILGCLVYSNIRSRLPGERSPQVKLLDKFKLLKQFYHKRNNLK